MIVVDIETTGFNPMKDSIVEIGIVKLDLDTGEREIIYDEIIKEQGITIEQKDSWIFKNTELKFEDVINGKPIAEEREKLQEIFDKYPATAYNKRFDFDFLKARNFKIKELPCPMLISTNICKIDNGGRYKWPKFQEAWDHIINKEYKEIHRGADDALHEAELVYELYKQGNFKYG